MPNKGPIVDDLRIIGCGQTFDSFHSDASLFDNLFWYYHHEMVVLNLTMNNFIHKFRTECGVIHSSTPHSKVLYVNETTIG